MIISYTDLHFSYSYGEVGYQIIITTIQHLFPRSSINIINIRPLTYDILIREVLALEAATHLIQKDLDISRKAAIGVLEDSCTFGNNLHDTSSVENETHIQNAVRRAQRSGRLDASVYRSWAESGSQLPISEWVKEQKDQADEMRIKREEIELDPFGNSESSIPIKGAGLEGDPIDLTLD